jgi:hypothetical protein
MNEYKEYLDLAKQVLPKDPQSASAYALIAIVLLTEHINGLGESFSG